MLNQPLADSENKSYDLKKGSVQSVQKTYKKIEVTNLETKNITIYPSIGTATRALGYRQASLSLYLKEKRSKPFKGKYLFKLV